MNCYHCGEPVSMVTNDKIPGFFHLCHDGHLPDRLPPDEPLVKMTYRDGCSMTFGEERNGGLEELQTNLAQGLIRWTCHRHPDVGVASLEPYTPNYPCDLPEDHWDGELKEALGTMLQVLEDTA